MPKISAVAELKDLWKEEDAAVKTLLGGKIYFSYISAPPFLGWYGFLELRLYSEIWFLGMNTQSSKFLLAY